MARSNPHLPRFRAIEAATVRWALATLAIAAMLLPLVGCAATRQPVATIAPTQRVYYPAPPAAPRLQFLTSLRQPQAWDRQVQRTWTQWLAGHAPSAANAQGRFISPYGMAVDNGRLYVCDVGGDAVHVIDLANRQYRTLDGGDFIAPVNITIAEDGTRYVCDTGQRAILIFDRQDQFIGRLTLPDDGSPIDLAIRDGELFVADIANGQVRVLSRDGTLLRSISSRGMGPDQLRGPTNLAFSPAGLLYVSDSYQQVVKVFDTQGRYRGSVGGPGTALGRFARPKGLTIDPNGHIYVADAQWEVVQIFDETGQLLLIFGGGGDGTARHHMGMPAGVYIDRTALPYFREHLDPDFEAEYLVFVVNQFGINKLAVYAYGRPRSGRPESLVQAD